MLLPIRIGLIIAATVFLRLTSASQGAEGQHPLNDSSFNAPSETAATPVKWFVERSQAQHQNDLASLPADGWRLTSLSVYGIPPSHVYATVWVQRPGPLQKTTVAVDGSTFDSWITLWTSQGYVPVIVTTTGDDTSGYVNAAVLEKITVLTWSIAMDKSPSDLDDAANQATANQQKMVSLDEYGTIFAPLFCAVFHHNVNNDGWFHVTNQIGMSAPSTLRQQATKPFWHPHFLKPFGFGVSIFEKTSVIYTDTYVGSWAAKLFLSASQIIAEDAAQNVHGRQIMRIQGGNPGLHVIWAEQDSPKTREFHATGPTPTGFKSNPAALSTVDGIMGSFMKASGAHEAQLAIGKGGNVVLERAYTWSEPGRHIIQPSDKFQLASLTKIFTTAAIQSLIDAGRLSLSTRPWFQFRTQEPWTAPPSFVDPRYFDITVDHLLKMQGGWDRDATRDWELNMIYISNTLSLNRPPTLKEFVGFLIPNVPLDFDPGTRTVYSNVGYMALTQVVETVTGMAYLDYLKSAVLAPAGIRRLVELIRTDASFHINDQVTQQSWYVGSNVQTPQDPTNLVANVFGGDGAYKETAIGAGNLACSAATIVKFINSHG
jgi:CubicO group peptidase (beta-lactamase class C family)